MIPPIGRARNSRSRFVLRMESGQGAKVINIDREHVN
jgi:hypothetical protein